MEDFSFVVKNTAGTESNPSFRVDGDFNTGTYWPGADQFAITTERNREGKV